MLRLAILLLLLLFGSAAHAAPREALLVTPAWLSQHLKDPDLVILHVGDKAGYDAGHIPGARFVTLKEISREGPGGRSLELPEAADLRARLAALGVSDRSRVVVYYGQDWVSPSTRVIFTLDAAGLGEHASLLDGGMGAWTRTGRAVTTAVPPARTGKLSPLHMQPRVADADFVRSHAGKPGYVLIDARSGVFYDGIKPGGPMGKSVKGHIPGAKSLPFDTMTTTDLVMLSPQALAAAFAKAGYRPGATIIAYCHVGQQATAVVFAARTLGYKVLLYDGSFEDWALRGLPVEMPAAR
jgi:thiosulfate/3-mercaptopyruvate sulfurtransferase